LSGAGPNPPVSWPVLVQYADGSDLVVVNDRDHWELDPELSSRPYAPEDRLIDSGGAEYRLVFESAGSRRRTAIEPTGRRLAPGDVRSIVERHIASLGAEPEWLAAYLADVAKGLEIRATILYLSKLERPDASEGAADGD
jgi:protein structure with unknown function